MTDDELEAIRNRRREELKATIEGPDSPSEPIEIGDASHFDSVVEDHDVVVVDFHAEWCAPCKHQNPILESVAASSPLTVAKVDIDNHQDIAQRHNVRSVPTIVVYVDGTPQQRLVGLQQPATFEQIADQYAS